MAVKQADARRSEKMRLCFIAGAHSVHTIRWVEYFARAGHEVHLISLGTSSSEAVAGINFHVIPKYGPRALRPFIYTAKVRRLVRRLNPDVLHAHQIWIDGVIGSLCGFRPYVLTPWGSDILLLPRWGVRRWLSCLAVRSANKITCDGENTRDALLRTGVPPDHIEIIRFGTDVDKFKQRPKNELLVAKLGIENKPIVISMRSLKPLYDVGTLIRAIPKVCKSVPAVKFLLVGDGSQREELKALASNLGVVDSVIFAGAISANEIPLHLNLADVYVSTSLSDSGLAASTAEAMSCSLPVVVTDSGDNNKWVKCGKNGFVVAKGDSEALADKIIYLLKNDEMSRLCGQTNRNVIIQKNNYYGEMKRMEEIYKSFNRTGSRY